MKSKMKLPKQKQVVSVPLAKELKELGIPQDSLWYWVLLEGYFDYKLVQKGFNSDLSMVVKDFCSAFTVAELILPYPYASGKDSLGEPICWNIDNPKIGERGKTEADARGKMWIYLIEQGIEVAK